MCLNALVMAFPSLYPHPFFVHHQEEYARARYTCHWSIGGGTRGQIIALDWYMPLNAKEPCPWPSVYALGAFIPAVLL